jgi:predicted phosphodiesterase
MGSINTESQIVELKMLEIYDGNWNGVLFIGDSHISSTRVGRRNDDDFLATVTDKLIQAGKISTQYNLFPVFLGDFMHKANDITPRLMIKTIIALRTFPTVPWTILGNLHDHVELEVSEKDTLKAITETGLLRLADTDGTFSVIDIGGLKVALTTVPYGHTIPDDIHHYLDSAQVKPDFSVLLTHADLEFDEAYPGATPLHAIAGCDLMVNGHMHKTQKLKVVGDTVAFNPGNITRLSVDMESHIPSVWAWRPDLTLKNDLVHVKDYWDFNIECIPLNFNPKVFFKDGLRANPDNSGTRKEVTKHFVESLSQLGTLSYEKTSDGSGAREELQTVLVGKTVAVSNICNALLDAVLSGNKEELPNIQPEIV